MNRTPSRDAVVHSVCPHDCADTCSVLSHVEEGRLIKVEGNAAHPVTQGYLCRKFSNIPERVYGDDRLLYPMKRTGPKGSPKGSPKSADNFERISWDEAVATIAERWKDIIAEDGPHAILPFFGSGTEGLVQGDIAGKRFFNRLGTLQLVRTICTKAGRTGYRYTMGSSAGADPTASGNATLVISWGINTASTNIHQHSFLKESRSKGGRHVIINPLRVKGAASADGVLQPRPGSDAALALGMMHVIIDEGLYDEDFVDRFTHGFQALKQRVREYAPEKVEDFTDIPAEEIREFARLYASEPASFIYVGPGCQRHSNGGMTLRTIACLPALTGAWRHKGCGIYYPTSTVFPVDWEPLEGNDLRPNPPAGYNMIHLARMLSGPGPSIRSLYVFNGNPASVLYDQSRLMCELARDDLFTVVHERTLTDTALYADIVLPATTQFEHADLLFSYYQPSLLLNDQAIEPLGECRSNRQTFSLLAAAMGYDDACFKMDDWDVIKEILALDHGAINHITLDRLRADGWAAAKVKTGHDHYLEGAFPTPSTKIEFHSETMAADGHDPLPAYTLLKECRETTPELSDKYPLFFITPSAHSLLNSNYGRDAGFIESEKRPTAVINPADAGVRGIEDGGLVRVFNDRGACLLWARVADTVRPGVVASQGQWWNRHYPDGRNANHTTPDFPADMGGGSSFNTNLVQVEPTHER